MPTGTKIAFAVVILLIVLLSTALLPPAKDGVPFHLVSGAAMLGALAVGIWLPRAPWLARPAPAKLNAAGASDLEAGRLLGEAVFVGAADNRMDDGGDVAAGAEGASWRPASRRRRGRRDDRARGARGALRPPGFVQFPLAGDPPAPAAAMEASGDLEGPPADEAALNRAKDLLDDARPGAMAAMDALGDLRGWLRRSARAQCVSNAWAKMWELVSAYPELAGGAGDGRPLRAFLNAELPGAFVAALRHWTEARGGALDWVASSLMPGLAEPGGGRALGDTCGMFAQNRDRWLMRAPDGAGDPGNNGDATVPANVRDLVAQVRARWPEGARLCTSDLGIDVSAGYNRQERMNARPHLGAAAAALGALAPGGCLVLKHYTWWTAESRALFALVSGAFERALLVKPATSRLTNSEVYLVCLGYRGGAAPWDGAAGVALAALEGAPLPPAPPEMAARLEEAAGLFAGRQADALRRAVGLAKNAPSVGDLRQRTAGAARAAVARWTEVYAPPGGWHGAPRA